MDNPVLPNNSEPAPPPPPNPPLTHPEPVIPSALTPPATPAGSPPPQPSPQPPQSAPPKKNSSFTVIIIILVIFTLLGVAAFFAFSYYKSSTTLTPPSPTATPSPSVISPVTPTLASTSAVPADPALLSQIGFENYSAVDPTGITTSPSGDLQYSFTQGKKTDNEINDNYTITFPNTWSLYTYTNQPDAPDQGTNLLLKRNGEFIIIRQQLFETGSCVFGQNQGEGMSYQCNLTQQLTGEHQSWKVFTRADQTTTSSWTTYGVCDQDKYANDISTYTTPSETDKNACTPWTQIGQIDFYSSSNDQQDLQDFINIVSNIQIVPITQ